MIAMRYGTVPIVRETGGLRDTVHAYQEWNDSGNGFSFAEYNSADMLHVIREAVELYVNEPEAFARLRARAMEGDFSWARSAGQYLQIYAGVTGQTWPPVQEEAVPFEEAPAEVVVEEKPVKKTRKTAAKKPATEKAPAEKKPAAKRKTTKKETTEVTESVETEEKAPAKKTAAKKTATKKTTEKAAEKKTAAKKTTKKETAKKGPAAEDKKDAAE